MKIKLIFLTCLLILFSGCYNTSHLAFLVPNSFDNVTIKTNSTNDFFFDIGMDKIENHDSQFKFGLNPSVGSAEEVIWDIGGDYIFLDTAEQLQISSSNANDNGYTQDTGAWNLIVYGLDENYTKIQEFVILNGTNIVTTQQEFLRTFRAHIVQSGQAIAINNANEGDILIEGAVTGTDQAGILTHNGQTLMAVYTCAANTTCYITGTSLASGEGKEVLYKGKFRNCNIDNCAFSTKYSVQLYQNSFFGTFKVPLKIPEKTDMVFTAQSSSAGSTASASFGLIEIEN